MKPFQTVFRVSQELKFALCCQTNNQAQSTFGCIVCHFVACSNARATRKGAASSYKPPVNMIARGNLLTKPQGTQTAGWPVRFVIVKLALPGAGETKTSHCDISLSISRINKTRARCARKYSTAGMKREVRNVFGQSPLSCPES